MTIFYNMKKTVFALLIALICSVSAAFAQDYQYDVAVNEEPVNKYFVSIYGGPSLSLGENVRQYVSNGVEKDLINPIGGIAVGKNFSNRYASRLAVEFGTNDGACNTEQTSGYGFYPFAFKNASLFADWIINGGNVTVPKKFNWRPYVGAGAALSFDFTDAKHPWMTPTAPNFCFAFRYGLILEYTFGDRVGIFVDGTHEWFTDNFDGLYPRENGNGMWKFKYGKHISFPFDMKINANFGLILHI